MSANVFVRYTAKGTMSAKCQSTENLSVLVLKPISFGMSDPHA